jgi:hypothetical protein
MFANEGDLAALFKKSSSALNGSAASSVRAPRVVDTNRHKVTPLSSDVSRNLANRFHARGIQ